MPEYCRICREETWRCTCVASRPRETPFLDAGRFAYLLLLVVIGIASNLAALWIGIQLLRYLGLL